MRKQNVTGLYSKPVFSWNLPGKSPNRRRWHLHVSPARGICVLLPQFSGSCAVIPALTTACFPNAVMLNWCLTTKILFIIERCLLLHQFFSRDQIPPNQCVLMWSTFLDWDPIVLPYNSRLGCAPSSCSVRPSTIVAKWEGYLLTTVPT